MREAPLQDWPEGALTASPAGTGSTTPNAPTATEGGEWRLHSANGPETIPSPIAQTFDAAIAIRDIIKAQLHRKVFIFPVLCFPDMVPDHSHLIVCTCRKARDVRRGGLAGYAPRDISASAS